MIKVDELINIIHKLKNNPIYRMSLTSKELFHSNFWAWMVESYPDTIKVFDDSYDEKIDGSFIKTYREKKSLDFIIETEKKIIFVENKFKSMPSKEQLKRYSATNGNINTFIQANNIKGDKVQKLILISFIKPYFKVEEPWSYISYDHLYQKLVDVFKNKHDEFIDKYIEFIELYLQIKNIFKLAVKRSTKIQYLAFLKEIDQNIHLKDLLQQINFETTLKKLYMSEVYDYIIEEITKSQQEVKLYTWNDIEVITENRSKHINFEIVKSLKFDNSIILNLDYGRNKDIFIDFLFCQNGSVIGYSIASHEFRTTIGLLKEKKSFKPDIAIIKSSYKDKFVGKNLIYTNDDFLPKDNFRSFNTNNYPHCWIYKYETIDNSFKIEDLKNKIINNRSFLLKKLESDKSLVKDLTSIIK